MLTGKEFISDYESNREDIDKWLSIKCPEKYQQFAKLLKSNGEECTWKNISHLYRYDKRLIFNCFKYISFLEEYLRAIVVRFEGDEESYHTWQTKSLGQLEKRMKTLILDDKLKMADLKFVEHIDDVRELRNTVSHNKIILEIPCQRYLRSLLALLPENYRDGFRSDMRDCADDLCISDHWLMKFD